MKTSTFTSKFLSRLGKIDQPQIESFVANLVRQKDFHRLIFDALFEGVIVVDSEAKVVFANEAAKGLLGAVGGKVEGRPLRRILKAKRLLDLAEEFAERHTAIVQREVRVRTPKGRVYIVSVLPLENEDAESEHALWILSDQTDLHQRQAERHQAESIRSMATLMAGIAHEIKNPLNSLNIHAQLIDQTAADLEDSESAAADDLGALRRSSKVLLEEIERLARILDQFIKAVRPASLNIQPASINAILQSIADLIAPDCERRRIELALDLDPVVPKLQIDPEQMTQAILNIAKNAMEAIDKPEGRIVLRSQLASDHVAIRIEDNGCGIAEEDRLRIFEPYHTTKFNGTGLGLMVVFRIVSAHGGAIALDSEVSEGSTFRIDLPLSERPIRLIGTSSEGDGEEG